MSRQFFILSQECKKKQLKCWRQRYNDSSSTSIGFRNTNRIGIRRPNDIEVYFETRSCHLLLKSCEFICRLTVNSILQIVNGFQFADLQSASCITLSWTLPPVVYLGFCGSRSPTFKSENQWRGQEFTFGAMMQGTGGRYSRLWLRWGGLDPWNSRPVTPLTTA